MFRYNAWAFINAKSCEYNRILSIELCESQKLCSLAKSSFAIGFLFSQIDATVISHPEIIEHVPIIKLKKL